MEMSTVKAAFYTISITGGAIHPNNLTKGKHHEDAINKIRLPRTRVKDQGLSILLTFALNAIGLRTLGFERIVYIQVVAFCR